MDDLLDLDWSSSSNSNTEAYKKNSTKLETSVFDSLAAATSRGPSGANYFSLRDAKGQSSKSRINSDNAASSLRSPSPASGVVSSASGNDDAFSGLFNDAARGTTPTVAHMQNSMSMAQRLELQQQNSNNGRSSSTAAGNAISSYQSSSDPWDFDMLSAPSYSTISSASAKSPVASPQTIGGPFDSLTSSDSMAELPNTERQLFAPSSRPQFSVEEVDDLLGLLGQPASASWKTPTSAPAFPDAIASQSLREASTDATESSSSERLPSRALATRTPSPPPHILGQVVSMGFSVQQARLALAATLNTGVGTKQDRGWDVQAAVEVLASDGAATAQRSRDRLADSREPASPRQQRRKTPYEGKEQSRQRESGRPHPFLETRVHGSDAEASGSTDDLLAQASAIGFSVLKSANAYWKTSKAQLAKALEEKLAAQPAGAYQERSGISPRGSRPTTPADGKPRWMTEETRDSEDLDKGKSPEFVGFKDLNDGEEAEVLPRHPSERTDYRQERSAQTKGDHLNPKQTTRQKKAGQQANRGHTLHKPDLQAIRNTSEPEHRAYVSPHRRGQTPQISSASTTPHGNMSRASSPPPNRITPLRVRIPASSSQLTEAKQKRMSGNEHFRLGRYSEAADAYTTALGILPEGHLARILVHNNRANARIKIGEERKAREDACAALALLLGEKQVEMAKKEDFLAALNDLESSANEGTDEKIDPHDAMGRALSRRAMAYEAIENWRLAMLDWQMIIELGDKRVLQSAGGMRPVSDGLARCRKAAASSTGDASGNSKPVSLPQGTSRVISSIYNSTNRQPPTKPSAAVVALRESAIQAELEDAERLRNKDYVDSRIQAWSSGKESNLRALIASLDTVLWEKLGWKKIGMHELISDGQLKSRYVRAISKVHPDKIPSTATVEERMIAAAVFSALSDAWNSLK